MKNNQAEPLSVHPDSIKFAPQLLQIQQSHPSPMPRIVSGLIFFLIVIIFIWATFGKLDVVAVAEGKLIPVTYLKIIQPLEGGIVKNIHVSEGESVKAGQVLVEMDSHSAEADSATIRNDLQYHDLTLRRINAELTGATLQRSKDDDIRLFDKVNAVFRANIRAYQDDVSAELASKRKALSDLAASKEIERKLEQTLPTYKSQESSYEDLGKDGFAGQLMIDEKKRLRIETEQDLEAQKYNSQSIRASMAQSDQRLAQIRSDYRQKLESERVATFTEEQKLKQEWSKQAHKNGLLQLKAPQAGIIKDLATHTPGTVVSPGTVIMTLVPIHELLNAEVWIKNEDAGFVHQGQAVKLKLIAYPFQKYGMIDGLVQQVSADSTEQGQERKGSSEETHTLLAASYKTLINLSVQELKVNGRTLELNPGMQVSAEIKLADQTVMEYLLSPVKKAFHEAARER
jgi:HlyD family secretion protein